MNSAAPVGVPKFCTFCGKPVPTERPAKFCTSCGKTLPASPASSAPSSPVISPANGGLRKASTTISGTSPARPSPPATSSPTSGGLTLSKRTPAAGSATSASFTIHETPKFNPTGLLQRSGESSPSSTGGPSQPYTSTLRKAPATPPSAAPTFTRPDSNPSQSSSFAQRRATIVPGAGVSSYRSNATSGRTRQQSSAGSDGGLEFLALAKAKADAHERARQHGTGAGETSEPDDLRRRNTVVGDRPPPLPQRAHGSLAASHGSLGASATATPAPASVPAATASGHAGLSASAPAAVPSPSGEGPPTVPSRQQNASPGGRMVPARPTPPPPMTNSHSFSTLPPRAPPSVASTPSTAAATTPPPAVTPFARGTSMPTYSGPEASSGSPAAAGLLSPRNSSQTSTSTTIPAQPPPPTPSGPPPVAPRTGGKKLPPPPPAASAKTQLLSAAPAPPSGGSSLGANGISIGSMGSMIGGAPPVPTSVNRPELPSSGPSRPPSGETPAAACDPAMRERVIKEIIDTEEDYIRDLEVIINVYLVAMREQSIGTKDQINNVFSNIEMIYKINKGFFLPVLKTDSVGKAFLSVVDYLKLYMVYCGNQDLSMQTLAALKANPKIEQFLYNCSRKPECRSMDLSSFLIKPIQRICKYPLLLRELLKNTPEDHDDRVNLESALQRMTSTVGTINEKKSDLDKKMRLYELSHKINLKGDMHLLNSPNRRLISEGELTRVAPKEVLGKKLLLKTQGHYFLFSDLFLFTKPTSSSYDLKAQVPLTQSLYKDSDIAEDAFELTQIGQKRIFFAAPSAAKKAELKKDLEELIASHLDMRYKKFVQKEIAKTLAMQVKPVNPDAPMPTEAELPPDFSVLSFADWKNKLEAKPLPVLPPRDDCVRFVCNSPAPESEKRVIKLTKDNVTLPALQDQIRKKFDIGPAVGFRIVYPNNDGSWEMCPLNDQRELEQCVEKKISDLFLTWLA